MDSHWGGHEAQRYHVDLPGQLIQKPVIRPR